MAKGMFATRNRDRRAKLLALAEPSISAARTKLVERRNEISLDHEPTPEEIHVMVDDYLSEREDAINAAAKQGGAE